MLMNEINRTNFPFHKLVPIVVGSFVNAYGLVRSLAECGTRTVVIDTHPGLAAASKWAIYRACPDPEVDELGFVEFCKQLSEQIKSRGLTGVFFATHDHGLHALAKHHALFQGLAHLPFPTYQQLYKMLDKGSFSRAVERIGVPVPKTVESTGIGLNESLISNLQPPIIVKPSSLAPDFASKYHRKTIVVRSEEDWRFRVQELRRFFPDTRFIVQEYIPGEARYLYTASTYSSRNGTLRALSIGHKLTQHPPEAGTILTGVTKYVEILEHYMVKVSAGLEMYGIANTEFKFDQRDGQYKIIEVNMRPGMWNLSAHASGVNLPLICLQDLAGIVEPNGPLIRGTREVFWTAGPIDWVARIKQRNFSRAPREIRRLPKVNAVVNGRDLAPFFRYCQEAVIGTVASPLKRLIRTDAE